MREYETTIIIQPEISEEGSAAILSRLDGILESNDAIRLICHDFGKRKLAYEIDKFQKGHYYMLSFLHDGQVVPEIERSMRLDESVLRFLTVQAEEEVKDIEARKAECKELEEAQTKRAAEKAARDAEEERERREAEATRAAEQAAAAEADETEEGEEAPASAAADAEGEEAVKPAAAAEASADAEPAAEEAAEEEDDK